MQREKTAWMPEHRRREHGKKLSPGWELNPGWSALETDEYTTKLPGVLQCHQKELNRWAKCRDPGARPPNVSRRGLSRHPEGPTGITPPPPRPVLGPHPPSSAFAWPPHSEWGTHHHRRRNASLKRGWAQPRAGWDVSRTVQRRCGQNGGWKMGCSHPWF